MIERFYRGFDKHVEVLQRGLVYAEYLLGHIDQLNEIEDVVNLGLYYAYSGGSHDLYFDYVGEATTEIDAKHDLARIMRVLNVLFADLSAQGGGRNEPEGRYRGRGSIGDLDIDIYLDVPWLPRDCEVEIEEIEESNKYTKYTVACSKDKNE